MLAPMPLCDTLLRLADDPALSNPKWSNDVLRKFRSAPRHIGYSPTQADRPVTGAGILSKSTLYFSKGPLGNGGPVCAATFLPNVTGRSAWRYA